MIKFPLRIVPRGDLARPPAAWFLPGDDPAHWLEDLSARGLAHSSLKLLVIPASAADRSPCGALVLQPGGQSERPGLRALPYGLLGSRLYLPVEAGLDPEASAEEIDAGLVSPVAVLHPAAGLVGFEEGDALPLSALLEAPARRAADWSSAHPGAPPRPRLRTVEPAQQPGTADFIEEGREGMGSRPLAEAPRAHGEPRRGSPASIARDMRRMVARAAKWLTGRAPQTASSPTWVSRLEAWAESVLRESRAAAEQSREIDRLLELLERDPDEGLRFAVPLQQVGSRGVAPGAGNLSPKDTDFDLGRLGGGQPAAPWLISQQRYAELHRRYRDAANRELRLGRFRRAAYIFAELLHDLPAAASALVEGRYYREAASIYRDLLKNPAAAASALERGGLLAEAVEIYLEERNYEPAGDLLRRIDRPKQAESAYRKAVERCLAGQDFVGAGRILETKVGSGDEALATYASGWPSSNQAKACLEARFDLLGRMGRHGEAISAIASLRTGDFPRSRGTVSCRVLAGLAGSYPDQECRRAAADAVLVTASRHLEGASFEEADPLVACVQGLERRDRLLQRDGSLYMTRLAADLARARASAAAVLVRSPRKRAGAAASFLRSVKLPESVDWRDAVSAGDCFWCAGFAARRMFVARCTWEGKTQLCSWKWDESLHGAPPTRVPMAPCPPGLCLPWPRTGCVSLPSFADLPACHVGPPGWLPENVLGLAWDHGAHIWTAEMDHGTPVVKCFHQDGKLIATHALTFLGEKDGPDRAEGIVLSANMGALCASVANRLVRLRRPDPGRDTAMLRFDQDIVAIATSPRGARPRAAVSFRRGGVVIWRHDASKVDAFAQDLEYPYFAFTGDGFLVALSLAEGRIYSARDLKVEYQGDFRGPEEREVAVLPSAKHDEFVVVTREGSVSAYRVEI